MLCQLLNIFYGQNPKSELRSKIAQVIKIKVEFFNILINLLFEKVKYIFFL